MFTATAFIGSLFILICLIVFVRLSISNRKKEQRLITQLKQLASEANTSIGQYDCWDVLAIGMDTTASRIWMVKNTTDLPVICQVNLAEVLRCDIIKANRIVENPADEYREIGRIELAFVLKDKSKPMIKMEFYNFETGGSSLSGELQLAEKWCSIVNKKKS